MAEPVRSLHYYYMKVPDKPGEGARILGTLRKAGVNLLAYSGFPSGRGAQLDFVPADPAAFQAVARQNKWKVKGPKRAFVIDGDDRVGACWEILDKLAAAKINVTAIGETGLDFFRPPSPRDAPELAFRAQLALARRLRKPVLVHCRDAHEETLAILAEVPVGEAGGITHCFSGDTAIARRCLDLGLLISLAGPVTYPKARALPEVAKVVPADRLVVETDCPFLPPQPYRGKRNEPAYLAVTAARVAELRAEPLEELASRMSENARTLLRLR